MYHLQLDLIDGLNGNEKLNNTPIDGIKLDSNLDIVINCIQQNLVKHLTIITELTDPLLNNLMAYPNYVSILLEEEKKEAQERKQNFISQIYQANKMMLEALTSFKIRNISDEEFHILAETIKNSPQIESIQLIPNQRLTDSQETDIINAITLNSSINSVIVRGFMSQNAIDAIEQKPAINLVSYHIPSGRNIREYLIIQNECIESYLKEKAEKDSNTNLPIIPILLGIFGTAAIITAIMLLNSILAVLGTVSLGLFAYGLFQSNEKNNANHSSLQMWA